MARSPEELLEDIEYDLKLQIEGVRKLGVLAHLKNWAEELLAPAEPEPAPEVAPEPEPQPDVPAPDEYPTGSE